MFVALISRLNKEQAQRGIDLRRQGSWQLRRRLRRRRQGRPTRQRWSRGRDGNTKSLQVKQVTDSAPITRSGLADGMLASSFITEPLSPHASGVKDPNLAIEQKME